MYNELKNQMFEGDCLNVLKEFPDECIDMIITSPPYSDQRKNTYGGIHPDKYVEWFLPISAELKRVLKPSGSFILNIKEKVVNGERHTYVLELILALKSQGWLWTEEYIWHKKNCFPGKWPNRFRDAWERCLHFTKSKQFNMYQDEVKVPIGDWAETRLKQLSSNDSKRINSSTNSGMGKKVENWVGKEFVLPTNVLHLATECSNKHNHSAVFPQALPEWFIKLLTKPNELVLDPFMGSGTTARACLSLDRYFVGIEKNPDYIELLKQIGLK
jgi:DNA modification methylase